MEDEVVEVVKHFELSEIPDYDEWAPTPEQTYFSYEPNTGKVNATFEEHFNLKEGTPVPKFKIEYSHFKKNMDDICKYINYFINFFDDNNEFFTALFTIKFTVDTKPNISQKIFKDLVLDRLITPSMIEKIKRVADRLFEDNIADNNDIKYAATPKITNAQAKRILAVSICIRLIFPLCLHYTNISPRFKKKTDYIPFMTKLIKKIITQFETDGVRVYYTICEFTEHRIDRYQTQHRTIWKKKQQLYGLTKDDYQDEVINDVILVKGLYKFNYKRSVVSFIDGIIFRHQVNFKSEPFKTKPVEIEQYDQTTDNDNYLSHAESMEMQTYKVDTSIVMFTEANINQVLKTIKENFNIEISDEEYQFYLDNIVISNLTEFFMHDFYSRIFHDTYATAQLSKFDTIRLLVILKKYLQYKGLNLFAQLATAKVNGKFKENLIKNAKFTEYVETSDINQNQLQEKYKYIDQLFPNEKINIRKLSAFVNSQFIFVDYDSELNGIVYEDIDEIRLAYEYKIFLSII